MSDCNGADILKELYGDLDFDPIMMTSATCIPCRMPCTGVFMVEYSIRAAQLAVFRLLEVDRPVPPVHA